MAKRFIVLERRGRWIVVDTEALPPAKAVRSSHSTQGRAQAYADRYNEYDRQTK